MWKCACGIPLKEESVEWMHERGFVYKCECGLLYLASAEKVIEYLKSKGMDKTEGNLKQTPPRT